jgi:hypothetical protein
VCSPRILALKVAAVLIQLLILTRLVKATLAAV